MPEQLCICCTFLVRPPSRRLAIDKFFDSEPSWMGQASTYMVLDSGGMTTEGSWSTCQIEQDLKDKLLFIYSNEVDSDRPFRACISVEEGKDCAVYTISFPMAVVKSSTVEAVEKRLMNVYEAVQSIELSILSAGPELEAKPTISADEAISAAIATDSLALWVIAKTKDLSNMSRAFTTVKSQDGVSLLRHPSAAQVIL